MVELVDTPPIFGTTVFCDEIRPEATGKFIYIGVYQGGMSVHQDFPVKLSRMAFAITIVQRPDVFSPEVSICIFLPGDPDTTPSVQVTLNEREVGGLETHASQNADRMGIAQKDRNYLTTFANLAFENFEIKEPGSILVRADIREKRYRLGSLLVSRFNP